VIQAYIGGKYYNVSSRGGVGVWTELAFVNAVMNLLAP
jgi:hypothetical protein